MEKLKEVASRSLLYRSMCLKLALINKISFILLIVLDIALAFYVFSITVPRIENTVDDFWRGTRHVADHLNGTINWLRSNPAGLKLNTPVNETLASFFSYHIYLWTTFIGFLRSDSFFQFLANFLALGFSTFVAAIHDFSQIFFLHFSCFDAYASKLCYLCYYTLTVLWSMVRGKKWNPLRKRKDTVILDTRQQFLATSLFVILLFILPTIFVYFVVFRALRLSVTVIQLVTEFIATWQFELYSNVANLKQYDKNEETLESKKEK